MTICKNILGMLRDAKSKISSSPAKQNLKLVKSINKKTERKMSCRIQIQIN